MDVYHTSAHGVAIVRMKCAARGSLEMQDPKITKNSPSGHHRTNLSGYIFATNSNISSTCPYNMVNFGLLAAEIISLVWGVHPS